METKGACILQYMKYCCLLLVLLPASLLAQEQTLTVYFPFGEHELVMHERLKLLYFLEDSIDKKEVEISISGYCDHVDNDNFNNALSLDRAEYVKDILLKNGIKSSQIKEVKGFGERLTNEQQDSEEARRLQRRVEIDFVVKSAPEETEIVEQTEEQKEEKKEEKKEIKVFDKERVDELEVGDELVLRNMNFHGGRHILLSASIPVLKELLKIMEEHPTLRIRIVGHICCEEPHVPDGYDIDTQTYELSLNRAKEIYYYLARHGIDPNRMEYEGKGPSQKIYKNESTEYERTANRRVEIVILDI